MTVERLALEPVGDIPLPAPPRGAPEPDLNRQVQDDRQVRANRSHGQMLQRREQLFVDAIAALIGAGRIEEAIRQHPLPAFQRRADDAIDMIRPRRREEDALALDAEADRLAGKEEIADALGRLGPAGLARHHHVRPALAQRLGEPADLRRLAGPLTAFECHELCLHNRRLTASR